MSFPLHIWRRFHEIQYSSRFERECSLLLDGCWTNAQPSSFCISFPCIFQQEVAQTYATHFHTSLRNEYSSSILSYAFNLSHHILYKHCIFVNYSHTHTSTPKSHTHAQNIQAVGIALRRVNFISQKHTMQFKIDERKIAC